MKSSIEGDCIKSLPGSSYVAWVGFILCFLVCAYRARNIGKCSYLVSDLGDQKVENLCLQLVASIVKVSRCRWAGIV